MGWPRWVGEVLHGGGGCKCHRCLRRQKKNTPVRGGYPHCCCSSAVRWHVSKKTYIWKKRNPAVRGGPGGICHLQVRCCVWRGLFSRYCRVIIVLPRTKTKKNQKKIEKKNKRNLLLAACCGWRGSCCPAVAASLLYNLRPNQNQKLITFKEERGHTSACARCGWRAICCPAVVGR